MFSAPKEVGDGSFQRSINRHHKEIARGNPDSSTDSSRLRLPGNYPKMGPVDRIKAIRDSRQAPTLVRRFLQDRTQANLLKQVRGSLPAIGSALNCLAYFCELRDVRPFPPSDHLFVDRRSACSDAAAFANYSSHLQKVCFFIGCSTSWQMSAVRHVAKRLKKRHGASLRLPNFIRSRLILRIIRRGRGRIEFPHARWLSFLLAFRVHSETSHQTRAYTNDAIDAFSRHRGNSLLGIRGDVTTPTWWLK